MSYMFCFFCNIAALEMFSIFVLPRNLINRNQTTAKRQSRKPPQQLSALQHLQAAAACIIIITTMTTITILMGTHLVAATASLSQREVPSESLAAPISIERRAAGPLGELLSFLYLFLYLFFLHQINCQGQATKERFVCLLLPSLCR